MSHYPRLRDAGRLTTNVQHPDRFCPHCSNQGVVLLDNSLPDNVELLPPDEETGRTLWVLRVDWPERTTLIPNMYAEPLQAIAAHMPTVRDIDQGVACPMCEIGAGFANNMKKMEGHLTVWDGWLKTGQWSWNGGLTVEHSVCQHCNRWDNRRPHNCDAATNAGSALVRKSLNEFALLAGRPVPTEAHAMRIIAGLQGKPRNAQDQARLQERRERVLDNLDELDRRALRNPDSGVVV